MHKLTREDCRNYIREKLFTPSANLGEANTAPEPGLVGVELETFPFQYSPIDAATPMPVSLYGRKNPLTKALLLASAESGGLANYKSDSGPLPRINSIEFPDSSRFLFEPGGQVEISTSPCSSIGQLEKQLQEKQQILSSLNAPCGIQFQQIGVNPWWGISKQVNQLRSNRYIAMEQYFNRIGVYGKQMMLQTCSLHINLDLGHSATTRAKRIAAANLLTPFAVALFANSAIAKQRETGYRSYRSFIWQHLDNARTGILPLRQLTDGVAEEGLIDLYLDFMLQAPLVYVPELGSKVLPHYMTLQYWLDNPIDGLTPQLRHLENHVSLLFPEVRIKRYLEIRAVDVPPVEWHLVPVMFFTALLYSDLCLDRTLDLLLPLSPKIDDLYSQAVYGLQSDEVFFWASRLMNLACEVFPMLPASFRWQNHENLLADYRELFTARRRTPADEQVENFRKSRDKLSQ